MRRREFLAGALTAGALASVAPLRHARARSRAQPNIVIIVVDDLRYDEYGAGGHPYLETPHIDALGASGVTFTQAYHTTPLCSPNRACILTGEYSARHGIIDNTSRSYASHRLRTFAPVLQRAGYETAHVGKWHMGNDPTPRPGYDYWVSFPGQGRSRDPELFENGRLGVVKGYATDLLTDRAIAFATRVRSKPFMLFLAHKAVHPDIVQRDDGSVDPASDQGFIPADRHRGRYAGKKFPRARSVGFTQAVRDNKPIVAAALDAKKDPVLQKSFGATEAITPDEEIQARAEMMLAVDENAGRLVDALRSKNLLENTMIMFMSDNGSFFGEHGLGVERRLPYEESIRSPLIVSHAAAIESGLRVADFALSIDIAPTAIAAAGADVPTTIQGRSILPLLRGRPPGDWRQSFLVEFHSHENPMPWTANLDYRVVRMGRYKYIRWTHETDAAELYDLESDPLEEHNLVAQPEMATVVAKAKSELARLVLESMGLG
ncbi:MAG TPA: sulfatase-like hydrolase/transferase [Steroidobacteraceae bacterium]|nr:sulfatase-like hydrolase/transferase [Steroidobacteraceae bacterium]